MAGHRCSYGDADSAIARTGVFPVNHTLRVSSCAREEPSSGGGGGSWPGTGAATGMLLIDSAIARTGVFPVNHTLCVSSCARGARHHVAAEVVAGRRRSYGDAADRQRDHANGGLPALTTLFAFPRAREEPSSGGGRGHAPAQLRGRC